MDKAQPLTRDELLSLDIQISHSSLQLFSHRLTMFTEINLSVRQAGSARMTFAFKTVLTHLLFKTAECILRCFCLRKVVKLTQFLHFSSSPFVNFVSEF